MEEQTSGSLDLNEAGETGAVPGFCGGAICRDGALHAAHHAGARHRSLGLGFRGLIGRLFG